jgi:hypothetical protein
MVYGNKKARIPRSESDVAHHVKERIGVSRIARSSGCINQMFVSDVVCIAANICVTLEFCK